MKEKKEEEKREDSSVAEMLEDSLFPDGDELDVEEGEWEQSSSSD